MAMSLQQLLSEEGFKGRRLKKLSRASTGLQTASESLLYPVQGRHKSSSVRRPERAKSDIPFYDSERNNATSERNQRIQDWKPRAGNKDKAMIMNQKSKKLYAESSEESPDSEIIDAAVVSSEIVEIGKSDQRYKDVYSNEVYSREGSEEGRQHSTTTNANSANNYRKNVVLAEMSGASSKRNSLNCKSFDDSRGRKKAGIEQAVLDTPAIDEAATQAIVSILSGHIKSFLQDEDFRASLRHNSFASLNFPGLEEGLDVKSKIITNLEQAIETVEKAAEGSAGLKELKKASLQLSVITGLNSSDLKDGFTSGIPNVKLAACAHLYLSVIYKLQRKDRIAAKHILQVFCDSPLQARTSLLPDLWDNIFLPHLSHLKVWYIKELGMLESPDSKSRKLKLLEKVYNETMDIGTNKFAVYYKDWLTEGVEPPSIPSVQIPFISPRLAQNEDPNSVIVGSFSPQPVVSKKLYDEVFRHKNGVELDYKEESYHGSASMSNGSVTEETHCSQIVKIEPDATCQSVKVKTIHNASCSEENKLVEHFSNVHPKPSIQEIYSAIDAAPHSKVSEIIIERIAKAFFGQQKTEESDDTERPSGLSIPTEFICPLTGLVFEDPVTLETGQSFERAAILNWFSKGNRTCPITSKKLECQAVPLSNFILKRVIDKWRSEHWQHILAFSSQFASDSKAEIAVSILEKLLIVSSIDERMKNVKQLICLGGLQFLIHRFNFGSFNEKKCVSALLSSCIEADSNCRNLVARNIEKACLIELLCSEHLESVENAISLMTELICLNRRKDAKVFLSGLQSDDIANIMILLSTYLQSSHCEQKSLVAVLLLHFHLLTDTQCSDVCIDEAIDAITVALESSFLDERLIEMCCKALLILGGHFSSFGKIMTEDWILKQAGFIDRFESDLESSEDNEPDNGRITMMDDGEEEAREEWQAKISAILLGSGKKSFLAALSMCLASGNIELVRVCLTTLAWLSSVLASSSQSGSEFELSAFSALICQLKACLEHGKLLEHKVLASVCLLNFSKIPECRVLLMMIGEVIEDTLECLAEVTWVARELQTVISSS
nr:putative E3 ubiquitin-protein ligase LIN-2 isoform X1 [Ipomoea batatas]